MKTFLEHVDLNEQKNTHMTHIEDLVLYGGVTGVRQAIFALRDMRDMLSGEKDGGVSVKWDGAPAVFAGIDPSDGEFFVAKKGIFNKNPKVYKTPQEIDDDTSGDLNAKLKDALKYLPELGIKGVIQGDFLFSRKDLKVKNIGGQKFVTFHPNTIVYAVPHSQAGELLNAKIGIVWHTTYTGRTFETMKATYDVNVAGFKKSKNVWSQDAILRDLRKSTMTAKETDEINKVLSQIGKLFNQISGSTLRELEKNQDLARMIETFNNTFVRQGKSMGDPKRHANELIKWINDKFQKEIDKRKSEKGKTTQVQKRDELLKFFSNKNKTSLIRMFELQKLLVVAKMKLMARLNNLGNIKTFVKTKDGYKTTGAEGYVAVDTMSGNAVKLVDRMEFSYNNFSPNIIKGWQSSNRK